MRILFLLPPLAAAGILAAQDSYSHHNLTLGIGAAVPQGSLNTYMKNSPSVSIGYGYRFRRYFQGDFGLDITFGAAQVRQFLTTEIGNFRVSDREYFLPMGGRVILPLRGERLLLAAGGGGAWIKYDSRVSQPSYYFSVQCPICSERTGWGYYGLANATYFFDYSRHFRVGATARFIRGSTNGGALGNIPSTETNDHWVNVFGEIGFSF